MLARTGTALLLAAALVYGARPAAAMVLDPAFSETWITTAPFGVTSMAWAPDGSDRLFLTTRDGGIFVYLDGAVSPTPLTTVAASLVGSETGLLGVACDPDFADNGHIYVFVTVSASEQQILRYTVHGDSADDETVIVAGLPTRGLAHNGGAIGVGPDGKLYWAVGDNGNRTGANDDLSSLAAKVGRAELDGSVPADNPFADAQGPNADHIWARGVRNPFTFTWQPETDRLWVNVVGLVYEQVVVLGPGEHAGWSSYDNTQPEGFVSPVIAYRSDGPLPFAIVAGGAQREGGVAAFTTQEAHGFHPGLSVSVAGVTDSSFDGTILVEAVSSPTTFSLRQAGPDAVSGSGTATGPALGSVITGGTFFDSTGAPSAYRGDYFFGDFGSGRVLRARIDDSSGQVVAVEPWAERLQRPIDIEVGPDGDLYYVGYGGRLYHARHVASQQGIIVSRQHARVVEGGRVALSVRLAMAPPGDVTVAVLRVDGDEDVTAQPAMLSFTADDWAVPQPVDVLALHDGDIEDDLASLRFRSDGSSDESCAVRVLDDDLVPEPSAGEAGAAGAGAIAAGGSAGQHEGGSAGAREQVGEGGDEPGGSSAGGGDTSHGGAPGSSASESSDGCGCRVGSASAGVLVWLSLALVGLGAWRRRGAKRTVTKMSRGGGRPH